MLKKIFLITASAIAGIYLTSEEGVNARKSLKKKKVSIEPVIKDLTKQANEILAGTKELNSNEIRVNIEKIVNEAKSILTELDLDKAAETIKEAIRVASRQLRNASNEFEKEKRLTKKRKVTNPSKKVDVK